MLSSYISRSYIWQHGSNVYAVNVAFTICAEYALPGSPITQRDSDRYLIVIAEQISLPFQKLVAIKRGPCYGRV